VYVAWCYYISRVLVHFSRYHTTCDQLVIDPFCPFCLVLLTLCTCLISTTGESKVFVSALCVCVCVCNLGVSWCITRRVTSSSLIHSAHFVWCSWRFTHVWYPQRECVSALCLCVCVCNLGVSWCITRRVPSSNSFQSAHFVWCSWHFAHLLHLKLERVHCVCVYVWPCSKCFLWHHTSSG